MRLFGSLGAVWSMLGWGGAARAQTVDIPAQGLVNIASLTEAVELAQDGAVLLMSAGEFSEAGPVPVDDKMLTIRGAGQGVTTISAQTGLWVINVEGGSLALEDVSIVGTLQLGVRAVDSSDVIVRATTFETAVPWYITGGAMYLSDAGPLVLDNVTFLGEPGEVSASYGGALFFISTRRDIALLTDVVFSGVGATTYGGAIYAGGIDLVCTRCTFDNTAAAVGGAIAFEQGTLWVEQSAFCDSSADTFGGAIYGDGDATIVSSVFGDGFGDTDSVYAAAGAWDIVNNSFIGNSATAIGSASDADLLVSSNLFLGNDGYGVDLQDSDVVYNWFEANSEGAGTDRLGPSNYVDAEHTTPLMVGGDATACAYPPSMYLAVGSPLIDAGDPAFPDPDGSRSDVGAFGGPYADPAAHFDGDGDGYSYLRDCDDANALVSPGLPEICNAIDDNCDGEVDDVSVDAQLIFYPDCDHDGQGATDNWFRACVTPTVAACGVGMPVIWLTADMGPWAGADCDDGDPTVFTALWRADVDGDGFADWAAEAIESCGPPGPAAILADGTDCDDASAEVHPGAEEQCNDRDDDCDGEVDEEPSCLTPEDPPPACGCASSPSGMPALALLAALAIGVRRAGTVRARAPEVIPSA